ncbi:MAG TPA: hypothetical protein VLE20_00125 [Blastocatellia bacterium]|jgi:hypothetical protein|nr:hypothetical protein [Blastocatellia bacterium]
MKARTLLAVSFALILAAAVTGSGQDKAAVEKAVQQAEGTSQAQPVKSGNEYLGPTADSIRPYRPTNRDPFKKTVKPKQAKNTRTAARLQGLPGLDVRRVEFKQKVDQARARDLSEPDPVAQYLVSELEVTGVFRDDRGYGAFLRATPTGSMFFIRNGARVYNGEVLRIEGDSPETGGAKVLFRELSYVEAHGKQTPQERTVVKAPSAGQRN